jgi:hypothetical protein
MVFKNKSERLYIIDAGIMTRRAEIEKGAALKRRL